jgi:hypothetical protein
MINAARVSVVLGNLGHIYGVSFLVPGRYDVLILYATGFLYGQALYKRCGEAPREG